MTRWRDLVSETNRRLFSERKIYDRVRLVEYLVCKSLHSGLRKGNPQVEVVQVWPALELNYLQYCIIKSGEISNYCTRKTAKINYFNYVLSCEKCTPKIFEDESRVG